MVNEGLLNRGSIQRKQWIDVMRGICILLVILGHSIGELEDPLNRFILSFHMPAFFFISGMCAKTGLSFGTLIRKKARTILIPQLTLSIINLLWDIIVEKKQISVMTIVSDIFAWFLIVLFYVSVIFWVMDRIGVLKYKAVCIIMLVGVAITMVFFGVSTPFHVEIVPVACVFYLLGYYLRDHIEPWADQLLSSLLILGIPLVILGSYWNIPVAMYLNQYGNLVVFFTCSILGIFMLCVLSYKNRDNRLLQWFGQNSIIIYILHFKLLKILHGVGKSIFPVIEGKTYAYPIYWAFFFITIIMMIPLVMICNRFFPFLFGKKRLSNQLNIRYFLE